MTEVEAHVGNILFRLFSIMHCNVKLIMENYEKKKLSPGKEVWEMRNIAFGIYPFASFYNHSCDPNVFIVYHKDTVVCHATQPIDAGQQVNYQLSSERQKEISTKSPFGVLLISETNCPVDSTSYKV